MDLGNATYWWVAAGVAVAAELATGTFYLLMIAVGLAAAAIAAHLGLSTTAQIVSFAVLGGGATAGWHLYNKRQPKPESVERNRDVNLDIGERVHVTAWNADRTARVQYRGTQWTARLQPGSPTLAGEHQVVAVEGNWLVLAPQMPR